MSYAIVYWPSGELKRKSYGVFVSRHQGGSIAKFNTKQEAQKAIDKEWGSGRIRWDLSDESSLFGVLQIV